MRRLLRAFYSEWGDVRGNAKWDLYKSLGVAAFGLIVVAAYSLWDWWRDYPLQLKTALGLFAAAVILAIGAVVLRRAAAREAIPTPTPAGKQGERIFVTIEPQGLVNLLDNRTSIEAEAILRPYIGKWLRGARGSVSNVSEAHGMILVSLGPENPMSPAVRIVAWFALMWADRLKVIRIGDHLEVFGQIRKVEGSHVVLADCEPVDVGPANEITQ